MDKVVLTPEMVQQLLRRQAMLSLLYLCILLPVFVLLLICILFTSAMGSIVYACIGVTILYFGFMSIYIANCVAALVMSTRHPALVKASRIVPVGEKEKHGVSMRHRYYTIYFHGYGKRNYGGNIFTPFDGGFERWFSEWDVRYSAVDGDKYYLLLDGLNRIVFFIPCKYFEYTGELSPNKYER